MSKKVEKIHRFDIPERIEHIVLMVTFTLLAMTGLAQKYAMQNWAISMVDMFGGIESMRVIHRYAATALMALVIYHGGNLTYKLFVLRQPAYMMLRFDDARDLWGVMKYNLGLSKEHPQMGRFNFEEKLEYWAVLWGMAVMIITGFMLWNPITTSKFLPGAFIPAAKTAHGGEALLAVLAIIIWHFYNTLTHLNFSIFTGWIKRQTMTEKHAVELEAIDTGNLPERPTPEEYKKRMNRFIPWSVVMTILLVAFLIWFVTFEQTAITTLP